MSIVLDMADGIFAAFRAPHLSASVRLGAPDDPATRGLPDIPARFAAAHPHGEVEVACEPSPDLRARLRAGGIDPSPISPGRGLTLGGDRPAGTSALGRLAGASRRADARSAAAGPRPRRPFRAPPP